MEAEEKSTGRTEQVKKSEAVVNIVMILMGATAVLGSAYAEGDLLSKLIKGVVFGVASGVYLLPAILGSGKRAEYQILATNVLFGWTIIGWVVCFIWSLGRDK